MDKIEKLKKLKNLLNDGAITQEEFSIEKSKILGIKNKTPMIKNKSTAELEQAKKDFFDKEKLKAKAKLEAEMEIKEIEKAKNAKKMKKIINMGTSKGKTVFFWFLTIFCFLVSLGSFVTLKTNIIIYLFNGIIFLILGIMACPKISEKTKRCKLYTKLKKYIIILLLILFIVLTNLI